MDSQLTLVQPTPPAVALAPTPSPAASIIFDLTSDLITSTTIRLRGSNDVSYTVKTHAVGGIDGIHMELVVRASPGQRVVATVRKGNVFPDRITLEDRHPVRLSSWLKWPRWGMFPVTFEDGDNVYAWILDGDRLVLSRDTDHIAWFTPSRFDRTALTSTVAVTAASLALTPTADVIRDLVVVSCILVVERMRRSDTKGIYSRGAFAAYEPGGGTRA